MNQPRFHALLPVRDEADIIGQCLSHMLTWADAIYVFDTGSVDETWEIIQDIASKNKKVIPLKKDRVYFSDTLVRGWLFHQARERMRDGDWFLRADADEFHHVAPQEFVKTRLRKHETIVWHQYYDFRLTATEVAAWEAGKESVSDRQRPIAERRKWFAPSLYSEPRLCQYRETMRWPATHSHPYNAGYVARERIPIRHYPHRDPEQLKRRCLLRALIMKNNQDYIQPDSFHWFEGEWRKFIAPDDLPGLQRWLPGTPLPEFRFNNHLKTPIKRAAQRLIHSVGLPLLDRVRPGWREQDYPTKIPHDVVERLEQELSAYR